MDDVVIARWQRGLLDLPWVTDSSAGQYVRGFSVVVLLWTDGLIRLPLAFRVGWGDDAAGAKGALAPELLDWPVEQGLKPEYVLFDAWYASKTLLSRVHGLGWSFVIRLRKNRLLDGRQLKHHGPPFWVKEGKPKGLGLLVKVQRSKISSRGVARIHRFTMNPPSTNSSVPVTKEALGEARNKAPWATSSGVAIRPSTWALRAAACSALGSAAWRKA